MLCYSVRGSGYSFTRSDVLDMDLDEAEIMLDKQVEFRKKEAKAIKSAQPATRRRR